MWTWSVNWGLSSLLRRRLMSLMHRSVCWNSNIVCGCCQHLTYTFWWLHDSSVCSAKWFRIEAPKTFLKRRRTYEMFRRLKLGFQTSAHVKRYETSDKFLKACKLREKSSIVEHVLRLYEYYNRLNRVGVDLPDEIVMVLQSHCHQATRASWWTIIYQG